ncbi:hypothetical protein D3C71_1296270 [compost metagenome]
MAGDVMKPAQLILVKIPYRYLALFLEQCRQLFGDHHPARLMRLEVRFVRDSNRGQRIAVHTAGIDMNFIADPKSPAGCNMPEYMIRVIADCLLFQVSQLRLRRRFPVQAEHPLVPGRIFVQLPDVFVPARRMRNIE